MYEVFQSGRGGSSLSEEIKTRLVRLDRISFAEEALELTSNHVEQILFNDIKRLDSGKHSKKPCKSKSKRTKFY